MTGDSLRLLRDHADVHYDPTLSVRRDDLLPLLAEADAIVVRNRLQVRGEILAGLSRCRVIGRLGVGLDNIDLETCRQRSIHVIPATGQNALSVAEWVITTAMMLLRGCYQSTAQVQAGAWPKAGRDRSREIHGKTLGIIGYGSIGRLVAKLAIGLGMRVATCARREIDAIDVSVLPIETLLAESDVVSLHLPFTPETRNFFDAAMFASMKPDAVLINAARGGIVDESALDAALRSGRLAGAAMDVFATEPLPGQSPLAGTPNLVLTPHIAAITQEAEHRVCDFVARAVLEALGRNPVAA